MYDPRKNRADEIAKPFNGNIERDGVGLYIFYPPENGLSPEKEESLIVEMKKEEFVVIANEEETGIIDFADTRT